MKKTRRLYAGSLLLLQDPECNPKLSNPDQSMDDEGCQELCREPLEASNPVDDCAECDYLENPVDMEDEVCMLFSTSLANAMNFVCSLAVITSGEEFVRSRVVGYSSTKLMHGLYGAIGRLGLGFLFITSIQSAILGTISPGMHRTKVLCLSTGYDERRLCVYGLEKNREAVINSR